eukprot:CAMPEP_0171740394 /NCGR_PEP_ID=MMETSP0991-20121206/34868_1 /TAXON_ID=483369 /ORGANISM="non described non described, Strain CCMP2098" /LENGTH=140 /DNA_ID=CAMNT_0012338325 /DNA_START=46 /DNA_END=468 /DNA_ORIENTATION=+
MCDRCPAVYHPEKCLGYSKEDMRKVGSSQWSCPHHQCSECGRKAQAVGGLIFRCECCPKAYCEDHLPIDAELIGHCERFEALGMRHPDQACFIHCSSDCHTWATTYVSKQQQKKSATATGTGGGAGKQRKGASSKKQKLG